MFVFRALFWLGMAVVFVPVDYFEAAQTRFYEIAPVVLNEVGEQLATTILDLTDTCADRPDICDAAKDLFTATSQPEPNTGNTTVVPTVHDERI